MALNVPVFLTRLSSAIVFGLVMLVGLFGHDLVFISIFFLVNILCLREYASLVEKIIQTQFKKNEKVNFIALGIAVFMTVMAIPLVKCHNSISILLQPYLFYFIGLVIGILIVFFMFSKSKKTYYLLSGIAYISIALALLVQLRFQSLLLPIALIFFIWMNDTLAYLTGSFIGKTPFFPAISPKKTWEGIIGGTIFTLLLAFIWGYFSPYFELWQWIGLGLIGSIIGNMGDLIESKLKRLAGVKDSGNLMPGHGGALDRFDSLLFAAPFAFLFALFFMACVEIHFF